MRKSIVFGLLASLFVASNVFAQEISPPIVADTSSAGQGDRGTAATPVVQAESVPITTANSQPATPYTMDSEQQRFLYAPAVVVVQKPKPRFRWVGLDFSAGLPSGLAVGVVVHPAVNWLHLNVAGTYALSPGLLFGATFDPMPWAVGLTLTPEAGFVGKADLPGVKNSPQFNYQYESILLGLEFGRRSNWRFYIRGGPTHINANSYEFSKILNLTDPTITVGNPTVGGWLPTGRVGFDIFF